MTTLRLLGGVTLRSTGGAELHGITAQPKRLALLVCLLLDSRAGPVRRDTLLALLWPELDAEHARHALRQSLYALRRELGRETLASNGDDEIRILHSALGCDAVDFAEAVAAGDHERALALYRGDLLPGFHISGCVDFEQWLEGERLRLRLSAIEAATALADAAMVGGRRADAARWRRRACELAPFDERLLRLHLESLDEAEDAPGALLAYETFAARSRRELGIGPGAETEALVQGIRTCRPLRRGRHRDPAAAQQTALPQHAAEGWISAVAPGMAAASAEARSRVAGLALLLLLLAAAFPVLARRDSTTSDLAAGRLAILPFSASESDSVALRLARAMPLLLSGRFDGEAGPTPMDPAQVLAAATRHGRPAAAPALARTLGADRVIAGALAHTEDRLAATATLVDARTRHVLAQASLVAHRADTETLLDDLLGLLLVRSAGEPAEREPHLLHAPLPALQWYLRGQSLLREAHPRAALDAFARALEIDSTFATAALAASVAAGGGGWEWLTRGAEHAWRWRHRLAPADRELLLARLGPRYPEASSLSEQLGAWETLVSGIGGRPYEYEALYGYADLLFHYGTLLGLRNAHAEARRAFERAALLDTTRTGALQHLADLAFLDGDAAQLRLAATRLLRRPINDTTRGTLNWMRAALEGDETSRLAALPRVDASVVFTLAQQAGIAIQDAERLAELERMRATTLGGTIRALERQAQLALNRGRPLRAAALLDSAASRARDAPHLHETARRLDRQLVLSALYWQGDTVAAGSAARRLQGARGRPAAGDPAALASDLDDLCVLEQWRLHQARSPADSAVLATLAGATPGARICGLVIGALSFDTTGGSEAALRALEEVSRYGEVGWDWTLYGSLVLARALEQHGRSADAYAAIRRRGAHYLRFNQYLSTQLREEGRLSLLARDTVGAIRAWHHYLALRPDPEPPLRAERDRIEAALAALQGRAPGAVRSGAGRRRE